MKRYIRIVAMSLLYGLVFVGCGAKGNDAKDVKVDAKTELDQVNKEDKKSLTVFAAASMTESLTEIKDEFEKENPGVNLVFNFDSSGTLKSQIAEGAACDVFISAASKQMDELDPTSGKKDSDLEIDPDSRFNLLENEVTLAVKEDSSKDIKSFEDLNTNLVETIALGNADVPVGQYSESLLKNMGIWDAIKGKITFGSNVKEVTSWISEGAVDCGIIYSTDAKAAGLKIVAKADPTLLDKKVIYPAAVLKDSKNREDADKFISFLNSDKAREIFEKYGFKQAE
ncbi:molybdate ABC transporter substrate-binding protein [Anaerococcus sp. NML200574]|uniref:molybdate ABC transporter substrate-binding protein n=1 Tax=Anaerococcus sp. NML200574 TaxID=2954486 RepID=UPI002237414D|nr:molybdate ABC transporter substrate-binding protein [Anaerococcus sp. NML200574]MCW6677729.1 molybdate ABC transporter substrate-binding protein [Anaerococcus sp. NML200574]